MRKRIWAVVLAVGVCVGCTSMAVKQVVYTATGPEGGFLLVASESDKPLANYDTMEVARFDNDLPGTIDDSMIADVQNEIVFELREKNVFSEVKGVPAFQQGKTASPTVVMRGRLVDITSDRIPGQKLIGGGNHLIAVVELVDKSTGKVLAKANVRGVVKSVVESGEKYLAKGMARGAKKLCDSLGRKGRE